MLVPLMRDNGVWHSAGRPCQNLHSLADIECMRHLDRDAHH